MTIMEHFSNLVFFNKTTLFTLLLFLFGLVFDNLSIAYIAYIAYIEYIVSIE